MKGIVITIAFQLLTNFLFGQPEIKLDTTEFDFGQIIQGTVIKKEFHFTNTGTDPLVINRVLTGDGGSMATHPKEPILPGKKGIITFHYHQPRRIGKFKKCLTISSNAESYNPRCQIVIEGEFVWKPTTIKASHEAINIGMLNFGEVDTIIFEIINTGKEDLHIYFNKAVYSESDLLRCQIQSKDSVDKEYKYYSNREVTYGPDETIMVTALIKNVYGNAGQFEHDLSIGYNSHDTLLFTIKGQFVGVPDKKVSYEGNNVFFYDKDKLVKRQVFLDDGKMMREDFFDGSYCVHSVRYHWYKKDMIAEYFYKNGKLTGTKNYKISDH